MEPVFLLASNVHPDNINYRKDNVSAVLHARNAQLLHTVKIQQENVQLIAKTPNLSSIDNV